ncbi:hypothetical protein [Burkholderia plantarii]|uniref:hypothetical protein n=1 Tax=Burkholderia plantarii TaxID=41899 RepID=UPI00114D2211|nr:hypothetical protein [Burkholderia plantarii]
MKVPQIPSTWKGVLGVVILIVLIVSMSMQVQSWLDGRERAAMAAACERRVLSVRDEFSSRANERDDVVNRVKGLAEGIHQDVQDTLRLLRQRVPVTDKIARKVDAIDDKARAAAAESRAAKDEASRAARAAEANTTVAPMAAGAINETVRAVNRGSK